MIIVNGSTREAQLISDIPATKEEKVTLPETGEKEGSKEDPVSYEKVTVD